VFGGGFDLTNSILVDTAKMVKIGMVLLKLIQNPEIVKTLQDNLHETVKNTYSINNVTEQRRKLYLDLMVKKPFN
jgi:hypothetical protein